MATEAPDDAPVGWTDWLTFLQSEEYGRDVVALMDAIRNDRTLDIGLSIECVASCAFSAGLDAGQRAPAASRATAGGAGG